MRIDAHHHFWTYDPVEYGWIDEGMAAIRRDFLPPHLKSAMSAAGIDGVVSVQARQTVEETRWLLSLAERHDFIRGVVGWVPLASRRVRAILEGFAPCQKLKAVRHVIQGEADENYVLRPDFNAGVRALQEYCLAYDILVYERQLPQTIRFVDQHPEQIFVLDHVAKPRIRESVLSPWRQNVRELARRPNVYCKLSGMVTEADFRAWTEAQLRPYMEVVIEAFGPRRVMFGSDWPVCLVACEYERWHRVVRDFVAELTPSEQARLMGETATEAYRL